MAEYTKIYKYTHEGVQSGDETNQIDKKVNFHHLLSSSLKDSDHMPRYSEESSVIAPIFL